MRWRKRRSPRTCPRHARHPVIVDRLDQLAGLLAQPDGTLRLSANGALEVAAGTQAPLPLPGNLLEAFRQFLVFPNFRADFGGRYVMASIRVVSNPRSAIQARG